MAKCKVKFDSPLVWLMPLDTEVCSLSRYFPLSSYKCQMYCDSLKATNSSSTCRLFVDCSAILRDDCCNIEVTVMVGVVVAVVVVVCQRRR